MTYNITYNSQFNSHEIYFDGKPSNAVRTALKELKFRWHGVKRCWYGFGQSEESLAAVITGTTTDEEPATVVADGYLGGGAVYGSKSNRYLHGADLSAAIRADLKKAGIKNTTVKCKTYAGGQNITATVKIPDSDYIPFDQFLDRYRVSCSDGRLFRYEFLLRYRPEARQLINHGGESPRTKQRRYKWKNTRLAKSHLLLK